MWFIVVDAKLGWLFINFLSIINMNKRIYLGI